jgi:hypothetical protein
VGKILILFLILAVLALADWFSCHEYSSMIFIFIFVVGGGTRPVIFRIKDAVMEMIRNALLLSSYFVVWMILAFGITGDGFWPVFGGVFASGIVYFNVFEGKAWLLICWLITSTAYGFIHFFSLMEPFLQLNHFAFSLELPILNMILLHLIELFFQRRSQISTSKHGK